MKLLMRLLRSLGRFINGVRRFLINLLFFCVLIFALVFFVFSEESVTIENGSLLVLDIEGVVVDLPSYRSPTDQLTSDMFSIDERVQESSLYDILAAIDRAEVDDKIAGIHLQLDYFHGGGFNHLQLIGQRLSAFREQTGKPVIATGDYFNQSQYYLAAHASQVLLHPEGAIDIQGLHAYQNYFASFFEKFKVNTYIFKAGEYKTATEPYSRDTMSDAARNQSSLWLNDLWEQYLTDISNQRVLQQEALSGSITDYLYALEAADFSPAQMALQAGLVDHLASHQDMREVLIQTSGNHAEQNEYPAIAYRTYLNAFDAVEALAEQPRIQVILASGSIIHGSSYPGATGSDTLIAQLRTARLDDQVKGVVLRIDSPGGSAFASEVIRQEMALFRAANKPIYASFSATAASGGYWIALGADKIYAAPSSITGSIGVFGLFVSFEDAFKQIGIHYDGVSTTDMPLLDAGKNLPATAALMLQRDVDRTYRNFTHLVAEQRNIALEKLPEIAQGRVWTGRQAKQLKLVDQLGHLSDAVSDLAIEHKIEHYWVEMPQIEKGSFDLILEQLLQVQASVSKHLVALNLLSAAPTPATSMPSSLAQQLLHKQLKQLATLNDFNDPRGLYSRCTECIEVFK